MHACDFKNYRARDSPRRYLRYIIFPEVFALIRIPAIISRERITREGERCIPVCERIIYGSTFSIISAYTVVRSCLSEMLSATESPPRVFLYNSTFFTVEICSQMFAQVLYHFILLLCHFFLHREEYLSI